MNGGFHLTNGGFDLTNGGFDLTNGEKKQSKKGFSEVISGWFSGPKRGFLGLTTTNMNFVANQTNPN